MCVCVFPCSMLCCCWSHFSLICLVDRAFVKHFFVVVGLLRLLKPVWRWFARWVDVEVVVKVVVVR